MRLDEIREWVSRGRSVCPFATLAHRAEAVRYVQLRHERLQAQIWREARAFVSLREKALVLALPPPDPPTWEAARDVVWATWNELAIGVARLNYPGHSIEELRRSLSDDTDYAAKHGVRQMIPLLWGGVPHVLRGLLFVAGMGPQYPREHPRWAPHTLLSSTWMDDVDRARSEEPALHRRVQERMVAYAGGLYDADELWVAVTPKVTGQPEWAS